MKSMTATLILSLALAACSTAPETSVVLDDGARPNGPASSCEVYPDKIRATSSSHGLSGVITTVRVPYLGNGEMIEKVGFYGHVESKDLGNAADCHMGPLDGATRITAPYETDASQGKYTFSFATYSGTVLGQCPGYTYAWRGTFFLQTNLKTYWINPQMDPGQLFTFDDRLWKNLDNSVGRFNDKSTNSDMLRFYNPLSCTR